MKYQNIRVGMIVIGKNFVNSFKVKFNEDIEVWNGCKGKVLHMREFSDHEYLLHTQFEKKAKCPPITFSDRYFSSGGENSI